MTHPPVEPLVANRRDLRHRLSTRDAILIRRTLTAGLAINLLVPFFSGPLLLALMVHAHRRLRWSIQIGHLREASAKFKTPDGKTDRFGAGYLIERIRMRAGAMTAWFLVAQAPPIFVATLFASAQRDHREILAVLLTLHIARASCRERVCLLVVVF